MLVAVVGSRDLWVPNLAPYLPEEAEEEKNLNLSGLLSNLISRGKKEGEE